MKTENLDWLFDTPTETKATRYPLTDIGYTKDDAIIIDIACAGFSMYDIEVTLDANLLVVKGTKKFKDLEAVEYVQQVISIKDFERVIRIPKSHLEGEITAKMNNGILSIKILKKETPTKVIKIES